MNTSWYLYLIQCAGGSLYAGITNDVPRRYAAHVAGKGARYTRAHRPVCLVGSRPYPDRSAAAKAEHAIRLLRPQEKRDFIRENSGV